MSSAAVDPIEKKPVFHYRPGSRVASFGSVGCTMRCGHCQNWQISRPKGEDGSVGVREVAPQEAVEFARQSGRRGRRVHLQRAGHLARVGARHRAARPRGGAVRGHGHQRLRDPGGPRCVRRGHRRVACRHQGVLGGVRSSASATCRMPRPFASRRSARSACTACTSSASPTWSRPSTTPTRSCAPSRAGSRRSSDADTPWHVTRFIPYLEFAELPPTPLRDARARPRHRPRGGARLRLPGQRRCTGRRGHRLPPVRRAGGEPARLHRARPSTSAMTDHVRRAARPLEHPCWASARQAIGRPRAIRAVSCTGP